MWTFWRQRSKPEYCVWSKPQTPEPTDVQTPWDQFRQRVNEKWLVPCPGHQLEPKGTRRADPGQRKATVLEPVHIFCWEWQVLWREAKRVYGPEQPTEFSIIQVNWTPSLVFFRVSDDSCCLDSSSLPLNIRVLFSPSSLLRPECSPRVPLSKVLMLGHFGKLCKQAFGLKITRDSST